MRVGRDEVGEIVGAVPHISSFPTVDEMNTFVDRLAGKYPDLVRVDEIGRSRGGEPLREVRIGAGARQVVVFGNPHSNEPIGLATTRYLLERLAENPAISESLGVTWHFVPLIDPDATRLGEGWYRGPFTRSNVTRHYYRPPGDQQAEWTFPMTWQGRQIGTPLPETRALMTLIDATRPALLASLHNADFGGGFCYVTGGDRDYWTALSRRLTENGLPIHRGEPDAPGARPLAEGIVELPSFDRMCEIAAAAGQDPAVAVGGGSSGHYAARYGCAYLVSELPLWTDPRLFDDSPGDRSMPELVRASVDSMRETVDIAAGVLDRVGHLLSGTSPRQHLVAESIPALRDFAAAKAAAQVPDRPATIAEICTELHGWPAMIRLRIAGPLDRVLREEAARSGAAELRDESARFGALFERWCVEIERDAPGQLVPLNRLVGIQAATIVTAVTRLRDGHPI